MVPAERKHIHNEDIIHSLAASDKDTLDSQFR